MKQNKLNLKKPKGKKNYQKSKSTKAVGMAMILAMGTTKATVMVKSLCQNVTF
jgi:hypothetical protein